MTLKPSVIVLAIGNNEHTMTSYYTGFAARYPVRIYRASAWLGRLRLHGLLSRTLRGDIRVQESFDSPPSLSRAARLAYAARLRPPDLSTFPDRVADRDVTAYIEQEQRLKELIFRKHLRGMLDRIDAARVPVVLATLPRDLTVLPVLSGIHGDNGPQVHALMTTIGDGQARMPEFVARGLALDDKVSAFRFQKAMLLLDEGRDAEAADEVRASVEWDLVPEATPSINRIIREVATEHGAALLDLDQLAGEYIRDPEALFLDKIHLNAGGADVVGQRAAVIVGPLLDDAPAGR